MTPSEWIRSLNRSRPCECDRRRIRMFCFPPAGYGSWIYHSWMESLGHLVKIVPLEYPGKNSRLHEKPVEDLAVLADAFFQILRSEVNTGPYVVFGHSMGAWIAYEVLRRIDAEDLCLPLKFYASGNRSPIFYGKEFDTDPTCLGSLSFSNFWEAFERRYGLNENLQNKNIRRFVYPSFKADYKMIESYVLNGDASRLPICKAAGCPIEDAVCSGTVRIHCPIHALSGERDQRVTRIGLDGWKHVTSSTFSLHRCAGCDHDCIHRNNAALLKFLKADLTQVHRDHIIEA